MGSTEATLSENQKQKSYEWKIDFLSIVSVLLQSKVEKREKYIQKEEKKVIALCSFTHVDVLIKIFLNFFHLFISLFPLLLLLFILIAPFFALSLCPTGTKQFFFLYSFFLSFRYDYLLFYVVKHIRVKKNMRTRTIKADFFLSSVVFFSVVFWSKTVP